MSGGRGGGDDFGRVVRWEEHVAAEVGEAH